jgi:capsule polysaccharide export protein KpsE/RkpR
MTPWTVTWTEKEPCECCHYSRVEFLATLSAAIDLASSFDGARITLDLDVEDARAMNHDAEIERLRAEINAHRDELITASVMLCGGEDPYSVAKRIRAFMYPEREAKFYPDNF